MKDKKILIFHPSINEHPTNNEYTKNIYEMLQTKYDVKSLEWFIKHLFNKNIKGIYLNWYENTIGPDIMLVQKIQYFLKYCLLLAAKAKKCKIYFVVHNKTPHGMNKNSVCYKYAVKPFLTKCLNIADHIIVLCRPTEKYIKGEFKVKQLHKKLCFIPHGKYTKYKCDLNFYRKKYQIEKDELVFCFVGKMDRYKNIDIVIKSFYEAKICGKLLLAGKCDEEYRNKISVLIQDTNVICDYRFVSDEEMSAIMQVADAVVLPYDNTSMNSGIMINSFSNGTTVIGTDIEMLQDYPHDLVYGYTYSNEQEHIEALARAMKTAEVDFKTDILKQKGKKLETMVNNDNTWEVVQRKLLKIVNME